MPNHFTYFCCKRCKLFMLGIVTCDLFKLAWRNHKCLWKSSPGVSVTGLINKTDYCILPLYRFLLVMPAYSAKDNALAVKLITGFPENAKQGLPSFIANVMVLDSTSGVPQAVSFNSCKLNSKVFLRGYCHMGYGGMCCRIVKGYLASWSLNRLSLLPLLEMCSQRGP